MKKVTDFFRKGNVIPLTLVATAFIGFMTALSFLMIPVAVNTGTQMRLEPSEKTVALDETFTVDVVVSSDIPVNAFAGELSFDNNTLEVASIDYNTSIANLWAQEPWYSNGAGTLNFIGGTTKKGGFIGTDSLLTITFKAKTQGAGTLFIRDAKILQHDGLGTEAPLQKPIDALFTVEPENSTSSLLTNVLTSEAQGSTYEVVKKMPSPDLNGDGKQSIADISILMINIGGQDMRYDLNLDGVVDLKDFNIVLSAK